MEMIYLLKDCKFLSLLFQIDQEIQRMMHKDICCSCKKGVLHVSNYSRQVAESHSKQIPDYGRQFSFCCSVCRKRTLAPSVRFFGGRRRDSYEFLLSILFLRPLNERRKIYIMKHLAITERTIWRWRQYFKNTFSQNPCIQQVAALYGASVQNLFSKSDSACVIIKKIFTLVFYGHKLLLKKKDDFMSEMFKLIDAHTEHAKNDS